MRRMTAWIFENTQSSLTSATAALKEITGQCIEIHPSVMLLFDFRIYRHKELLANLLSASITLSAQNWKTAMIPSMQEWLAKVRHVCLLNKLSTVCKYKAGSFTALRAFQTQRRAFVSSKYMEHCEVRLRENILMLL